MAMGHAMRRAMERHGIELTREDREGIIARIEAGEGACIREPHPERDKLPIYFIAVPQHNKTLPVVVNLAARRVVTVLAADCAEVQWRMKRLFALASPVPSSTPKLKECLNST